MMDNSGFQQRNDVSEIKEQLRRLSDAQEQTIREQNELIGRLHECIIKYGNDVLFKSQKELIQELIQLADQVHLSIEDQKKEPNYQSLLDSMVQMGQWIDSALSMAKVRRFDSGDKQFSEFDSKKQEVIDTVETSNPSEDGCYKSELPGYVWTIPFVGSVEKMMSGGAPQKFEFVCRPEQVVKLKCKFANAEPQMPKADDAKVDDAAPETEPSVTFDAPSEELSEAPSDTPSDDSSEKVERKPGLGRRILSLFFKKK